MIADRIDEHLVVRRARHPSDALPGKTTGNRADDSTLLAGLYRPDCKQVCVGLVASRCGMPLGYQIFAGNRSDVTTLQEIVETMERRYGQAERIRVVDRGMVSAENTAFLKHNGRRYIVGTPKSMPKQFERELLAED